MKFDEQYTSYCDRTVGSLHACFEKVFPCVQCSKVAAAAAYSLFGGGKRIRGVLALATGELVGQNAAAAESYAAAIEMLHCYSLIHDDLPCMDDDDLRRGNPSCHKAYGEDVAMLAGDALLTGAFETLCLNENTAAQNVEAVRILARAAGANGMVLGQELDLAAETESVDEQGLLHIHENKTERLIRAAVGLGAVAGGALPQQRQVLDEYAQDIGLVFQIVDDILDVTSTTEALGKTVGSDAANHKSTFVSLLGLEAARERAEMLTRHSQSILRESFSHRADFLCELAQKLCGRKN